MPVGAIAVSFPSDSNSEIKGWLFKAEHEKAFAVLLHGVRSNRGQMITRAQHLQQLGITSLAIDFQAHGESPGSIITLGHLESFDAQAAVRFIKKSNNEIPVVVFGVSMGGSAFLLAKPSIEVDVLILESVYPDIKTAIANRLGSRIKGGEYLTPLLSAQIKPRAGIAASQLSPVKEAGRTRAATLVLSGESDIRTTVEDTKKLFDALPEPKMLYLFTGASHEDLERFDQKQYWGIVEAFIQQHIPSIGEVKP